MRRRPSHRPGRLTARVIAASALALGAASWAVVTASALTINVGPVGVTVSPLPILGGGSGSGATPAAQPGSGSGSTGLIGISGLPIISLPPVLTGPTPPPVNNPVPGVTIPCVSNCSNGTGPATKPVAPGGGGGGGSTTPSGPGTAAGGPGSTSTGAGSGGTSLAGSRGGTSDANRTAPSGLNVNPPPPVEQLTPLAGINFGQAPYLWPLFLLLDVVAAGAVVLVVRKTWSTAGAD